LWRAYADRDYGVPPAAAAAPAQALPVIRRTPLEAHLAVLHPGAEGFPDGGERSLTSLVVGVLQRLLDPADPDAGLGDFGYPVRTDRRRCISGRTPCSIPYA
jgi:hypothetical protein